jgi:hypothetical protein
MLLSLLLLVSQGFANDSQYDWNWLNKIIDEKRITTIEDLLPEIPAELRSTYTLMYDSRSLQGATYQSPRVIMNWDHAKKIISFNGDPSQRGGGSIEMIQFNEEEAKFEFHRIDFEKDKTPTRDQNLKRCQKCHREDLRPNWEHYGQTALAWPGAYAGHDDKVSGEEQAQLKKFVESAKSHPRYKYLEKINEMVPPAGEGARLEASPNITMTARVSELNYRRVARLVRSTKDYEIYKYAINGAIGCAHIFDKFFPENKKPPRNWKSKGEFDRDYMTAKIRWIFESRNINIDDWFMNFKVEAETNMFITAFSVQDSMSAAIAYGDPDLAKFGEFWRGSKYDIYDEDGIFWLKHDCEGMAAKSVEVLSK